MRMAVKALSLTAAGVLLGSLSGCGSDGDSGTKGASGSGGAAGAALTSKITAPAAFDTAKGWEIKADWLPQGQPLPYAVSPGRDAVGYLDRTAQGYVLNVRDASSGTALSTSTPWKGPQLSEKQSRQPSSELAVPQIALVASGQREYFAVWALGQARKDELHESKEVVSVAFYPVDASGKGVAPAAEGTAEAPDGDFDRPSVFAGPGGLLVTTYGHDSILVAPDGKVTPRGSEEVTLNGEAADPDYLESFPGPSGLVTNGEDGGTGMGGFGAERGWQSTKVAPAGADPLLRYDSVVNGVRTEPNGRIVGAAGNHLIANWTPKGAGAGTGASDGLSAIHDMATGAVQATAACAAAGTEYDADVPNPKSLAEVQPAVSPDGHYLVKGGSVYDLRTGKGSCPDAGDDAKKITLRTVGDDGTAYGLAGDSKAMTPVAVSAKTGSAEPLPEMTSVPDALTKGAGVFVTYAGTDTMRLVVLDLRG
ncbi:hypothetical protein OG432_02135 [Streptomyces sp. NBC_00442]|uniref:hypothetical protein n=1 Tax=Streptomyces sp. NBC_00442 TaxID=2903651 RepID=UPI002E201877